jgi:hypothetical protein
MNRAETITNKKKKKSKWQLFTNDGKFDSKLPPSQRLLPKTAIYYSNRNYSRRPRQRRNSRKLPTIFILCKTDRLQYTCVKIKVDLVDKPYVQISRKWVFIRNPDSGTDFCCERNRRFRMRRHTVDWKQKRFYAKLKKGFVMCTKPFFGFV